MLSRTALRLCAALLVVVLIGAALNISLRAQAQPAQTEEATAEATPEAQVTKFPPCPPLDGAEIVEPTETPTPTGTLSATPTFDTRAEFAPAYLGIAAEDVANCGSRVIEIISGSPADRAGFQLGDVIVAADGVPRRNVMALRNYIISRTAGQSVVFVVKRGEQELEIRVVLGLRPRAMPPTVTPVPTEVEPTSAATQSN
ncbi:MAG: PDZ domain-containing protein [Anaerolineae bacterium]|nr:PDZ domain-containing protein [Anaerolineae bacterium]